ncbi:MAG: MlaE family lipid ABC transporter permease subunit [Desulfarculaceae bacterium]
MKPDHRKYRIDLGPAPDGALAVSLSGRLYINNYEGAVGDFSAILAKDRPLAVVLELGGLEYLDSAGALALYMMEQKAQQDGVSFRMANLSRAAQGILSLVDPQDLKAAPMISDQRQGGFIEQVGESSLHLWDDFVGVVSFLGEFMSALFRSLINPRLVRWTDVLVYMERVGVNGLPIVGLIGFLLGLIMAFMSSLQLRNFGANIYVASLVSVAMVHELGPIMTAILVAGRSGSAFAAEIGTMQVNEEVDALKVMGYDPTTFLAIPKVLAAMLTVPLLTFYADLTAIIGGMLVGVLGLNLTVYSYLHESFNWLVPWDMVKSLIKSTVFALIIAGIGCQRGFTVRGGAQAVGTATTSAVVTAMFLIIVVDSIFAILFYHVL